MSLNSGIYQITNIVNGKRYIGSSENLERRKYNHFRALRDGNHSNRHLQEAFKKYGEEVFFFNTRLVCEKKDLLWFEQRFLNKYDSEYNILPIAGSPLGVKQSIETCEKKRQIHLGKIHSSETREKLRQINLGKKLTQKTIEKLRQANLGKKRSIETLEKMRQSQLRYWENQTVEARKEFGNKHRVKVWSIESRNKIGDLNRGRVWSIESRNKIKDSHYGKKHSLKTIEKQRQSMLKYWENRKSL